MKKSTLTTIIVVAVVALLGIWMYNGYNEMVVEQENVESVWAQVEAQYQRRNDLIPGIAKAAKGDANREIATLTALFEARSKATSVTVDPSNMTEEQLANYQQAQSDISSAFSRLLVSVEAYPDLKANQSFQKLIDEWTGTENRIAAARITFNEEAKKYNTLIRKFPKNILASIFGFNIKPYFKSEEGAENTKKLMESIDFDF